MWYEWANTNRHQYPYRPAQQLGRSDSCPTSPRSSSPTPTSLSLEYPVARHQPPRHHSRRQVRLLHHRHAAVRRRRQDHRLSCPRRLRPVEKLPASTPTPSSPTAAATSPRCPPAAPTTASGTTWSVYGQFAQGSIVPPSSVFDYNQGHHRQRNPARPSCPNNRRTPPTRPEPSSSSRTSPSTPTTSTSTSTTATPQRDSTSGEPVYFLQPSSITQGFEAESNIHFGHGLGAYLNASYNHAVYSGALNVNCNYRRDAALPPHRNSPSPPPPACGSSRLPPTSKPSASPTNARPGTPRSSTRASAQQYMDNGAYHNQSTITRFNMANAFLNYTLRSGGRFDQTKFRLSLNNIFNSSSVDRHHAGAAVPSRRTSRPTAPRTRTRSTPRPNSHQRSGQRRYPRRAQHHALGHLRPLPQAVNSTYVEPCCWHSQQHGSSLLLCNVLDGQVGSYEQGHSRHSLPQRDWFRARADPISAQLPREQHRPHRSTLGKARNRNRPYTSRGSACAALCEVLPAVSGRGPFHPRRLTLCGGRFSQQHSPALDA